MRIDDRRRGSSEKGRGIDIDHELSGVGNIDPKQICPSLRTELGRGIERDSDSSEENLGIEMNLKGTEGIERKKHAYRRFRAFDRFKSCQIERSPRK